MKKHDLPMEKREDVVQELRETIGRYKNIVISGEVGVGKITKTLEALRETGNVYYIGNPVDYVGMPRPKGYEKYIHYIVSLKSDMRILMEEREVLSFDFASLPEKGAIVLVDEIYGRTAEQYERISRILDIEGIKVIIVAGCLKNVGKIIRKIDIAVMLIHDGILLLDRDFVVKICTVLSKDISGEQAKLFG